MRGNDFLDNMELVDPKFIEEAEQVPGSKKKALVRWGTLAACLAVCLFVGSRFVPMISPEKESESAGMESEETIKLSEKEPQESMMIETQETEDLESKVPQVDVLDLPILTPTNCFTDGSGMGDCSVRDISELVNGNPWREGMEIETLPVYRNPVFEESGWPPELSEQELAVMEEKMLAVAERWGIETEGLVVTAYCQNGRPVPSEEEKERLNEGKKYPIDERNFLPKYLGTKVNGYKIEVDYDQTVYISLGYSVSLPETVRFSEDSTYQEYMDTGNYFIERYGDFLAMENPQVSIDAGWYNVSWPNEVAEKGYGWLNIYDGSGTIAEQLVNYFFRRIEFYPAEGNRLGGFRVYDPDLSEKLGDYPVITTEEARQMLQDGKYIADSTCDFPGVEKVGKVELVYLNHSSLVEYYMPYYKFYAELSEESYENPIEKEMYKEEQEKYGIKRYGVYYVPAVEEAYLSDVTLWDGRGQ